MIAVPVIQRHPLDVDTSLMLEVKSGSHGAFEELFRRHKSWVHRYLASAASPDQSDDLTQEVFLRVYRSRQGYQPTARFTTWLFTIVSNVAKNAARNAARRHVFLLSQLAAHQRVALTEMVVAPRFESPESCFDAKEFFGAVRREIGKLNARQQTALRLFAVERCSYDQIAERMGISPQAVKSLLARARSNLTGLLNADAVK